MKKIDDRNKGVYVKYEKTYPLPEDGPRAGGMLAEINSRYERVYEEDRCSVQSIFSVCNQSFRL